MSKSRVDLAVFVPSMRYGGAERVALTLAEQSARRGYRVDLVLAQAEGVFLSQLEESVRVVDLGASRVLSSLPSLVRYLDREQPVSMLSMMAHANIVSLWARRLAGVSTRVIVSERNSISWRKLHPRKNNNWVMLRLIRRYYGWADGIIAVSHGTADELAAETGVPRERISAIYNPVVRPELRSLMQAPVEHPWFQPGNPPVILGVGRLTIQKDFPTLIQAFEKVRRAHDARLVILGDGSERPALEEMVRQLDLDEHVSLPGYDPNPYAYMSRSTVFVLSSRWEGLPGVLIEALHCGVPVVATDCPTGPHEILRGGQYGQLVPVGDVDALAAAMDATLNQRFAPAPDESWHPYDLDHVVNQYLDVLVTD